MPRKTLALIVSLFVLSIVLFILAVQQTAKPVKQTITPTTLPVSPTTSKDETKISFSPNPAFIDSNDMVILSINLQSTIKQITGVQLALSYNPDDLNFISLKPTGIFSDTIIIFSDVDKQKGNINYTIGITPQQSPLDGSGKIAKLIFTKRSITQSKQTTVSFLENTIVSARVQKDSILKNREDAIIKLEAPAN